MELIDLFLKFPYSRADLSSIDAFYIFYLVVLRALTGDFFPFDQDEGRIPRRRGVSFRIWLGLNAFDHCKPGMEVFFDEFKNINKTEIRYNPRNVIF